MFRFWSCLSEANRFYYTQFNPHETVLISEAHPEDANSEKAQDSSEVSTQPKKSFKYNDSHPEDLIIVNKNDPLRTRSTFKDDICMLGFISLIDPTSVDEALSDGVWIVAMQEELN